MKLDYAPATELLNFEPSIINERLLCGPGPVNIDKNVQNALTLPVTGHMSKEFFQIMDRVKQGLQYVFQTQSPLTLALSGTGHVGMECAMVSLIDRSQSETVLIAENGIWGQRAAEMARRSGAGKVVTLEAELGKCFSLGEIESALKEHKPSLLFLCHGESSTGVVQHPMEGVGDLCQKYGCLLLVDTVASLGTTPFFMDRWKVDCVYSASQKALGASSGLAPISFSQLAINKILARKEAPQSFYLDINMLGNYWNCWNKDEPRRYHHTAPINLIYGLYCALTETANEGLENTWTRHATNTKNLHQGLASLELELFVVEEESRLPAITTIKVPEGLPWKEVTQKMGERKIEIAGGLGPTVGKVMRIGLMGPNSRAEVVERVLKNLGEVLKEIKSKL